MKLIYNQVAANAEADVGASARRILLMEDDAEKSENRLAASIRLLSLFTVCPRSLVRFYVGTTYIRKGQDLLGHKVHSFILLFLFVHYSCFHTSQSSSWYL